MMRKGVVTALQREPSGGEAPYVAASLITSPDSTLWQPIQAAPLNGWPPPRAMCWFEETGNGSWVCAGSIGHRDTILRDHFTMAYRDAATFLIFGDTTWFQSGTLGTIAGSYTPGGRGVIKLTSTAVATQFLAIQKVDTLTVASSSLWYSARVRYVTDGTNDPTNLLTATGLASTDLITFNIAAGAGDVGVFAQRVGTGGNWALRTINQATGDLTTDTGNAFAFDTWYWIDIVHNAGAGWASMWVNGEGPTTNTGASLPVPDAGYEPFATIYPVGAASRRMNVDFIGLEHFTAAVQP